MSEVTDKKVLTEINKLFSTEEFEAIFTIYSCTNTSVKWP